MFSKISTDAATETVTDLTQNEMVFTLLKHCQSMKRQETRLRLATGFLILMAFIVILSLQYHKHISMNDEPGTAARREPIAQAQRDSWPRQKFYFELTGINKSWTEVMQWRKPTTPHSKPITSIPVPTDGLYFVYLNMAFRMPNNTSFCKGQKHLDATVNKITKAYQGKLKVFSSSDTIACIYPNFRNVYIGRLVRLKANDTLEVTVKADSKLIDWYRHGVFFGGYLTGTE